MMRALLRNLLVVVAITALTACASWQPNRILLNEDFGLGVKIGDSVDALNNLPPYDLAMMTVASKKRMVYLFESKGGGKRLIVKSGSPEEARFFKESAANGWYLTIATEGGVVATISVNGFSNIGIPPNITLRGVPLKDINPSRLQKMFPWLEKSPSTALAKNEEMFHYSDKNAKLPNHTTGRLYFSIAFKDEKVTMLILTAS
jgi:hypothetical protein